MRTSISSSLLLVVLLPACGVAAGDAFFDGLEDQDTSTSTTTGAASDSGWPGPISTVTTAPPSESEGDASTTGDATDTDGGATEASTTADEPLGPPQIIGDPIFTPNPIKVAGFITVTVKTKDADAVTITTDEGEEVSLVPGDGDEPGTFVGQLAALTGLKNGKHDLLLVPSRAGEDGPQVYGEVWIDLPKAGSHGFWETGDLIGPGEVAAIGMLPEGDVIELGSRMIQGKKGCYLRRRDPNGAWAEADLVDLLPGVECEAVDMKIADKGEIFALVRRQTNSGLLWWLAEMTWGGPPKSRGLGAKGEEVHALAEHGGTVAVCGTVPTQQIDELDALVEIFRPDLPGQRRVFDYQPDVDDPQEHKFRESVRDCVLRDHDVVVVGDAYGQHVYPAPLRSRRFTLTHHLDGDQEPEWIVPEWGFATQSFATAVDVAKGELVTVGYICDDVCEPEGWLWLEGAEISLGKFPVEALAPSDVRWSETGGYAVVASAGQGSDLWAFTVRAYKPDASLAWTYLRKDPPQIHLSRAVFVGPLGELWAGGWGASGYPAVANIHR